jgi:hypothetical protein
MDFITYLQIGFWSDDVAGLVIIFLLALFYPAIVRTIGRARFRSADFARIRGPRRIEISPAGLRETGGIADTLTPWSSIRDVAATPAAAYFFILKNAAQIVPSHAFRDQAAFDGFVAAAQDLWRQFAVRT